MDLLFRRYASPFPLLDLMIQSNRFSEFVEEAIDAEGEQKLWELYLHHRIIDKSFEDFKKSMMRTEPIENKKMTEEDIEATIKNSNKILNSFNPYEKRG